MFIADVRVQVPPRPPAFSFSIQYGRVVELVDSLDSGSSVHCGRAGSSPASPTRDALEAKIRDNSKEGMAVCSLFAVISYFLLGMNNCIRVLH